jgi:hypothetical protein
VKPSRAPIAGPVAGRRRRTVTAVAAAGAGLLLSACGSGMPGVAADVAGDRISDTEVDRFARVLCALNATPGQPPSIPTSEMRFSAMQILLGNELAEDVADIEAVDPAVTAQAVEQAEASRDAVPARYRDTFEEVAVDYAVAQYAIIDLGRAALEAAGEDPAQVTEEAAYVAGDQLRQEYARTADVNVDPRFGRLVDGALERANGSLSVPVSELAVAASSEEGAEQLAGMLPVAQKCG